MREITRAIGLKREGKCKRVIVAGCLVQRRKTELLAEAPEIDKLVGVFDREHIVQAVRGGEGSKPGEHFLGKYHPMAQAVFEDDRARLRLTPRHYAYLRISEGCNQGCAFCTIPSIRGPMRSKPVDRILAEARELAADGAVELNLIGQDTTSFGQDIGFGPGLAGMLKTLDKELTDVHWLRLMYAYPSCFTDEMIRAIADSPRIVKYIDMPLQHINDQILTRMRRRVTRREIETLLEKLRAWIPGIAIRTTLIAGSPGETQEQHEELVKFVRDFGFDMLGVFPYSAERETSMGRMDGQIPSGVKESRVEELMLAQQEVAFAKAQAAVGKTVQVLLDRTADSAEDGDYVGRTAGQAPEIDSVTFVRGKELHPGKLLDVKIKDTSGYDLIGAAATGPVRHTKPLITLGHKH
jgi:ribosomal protein S12 methylthiotransferase